VHPYELYRRDARILRTHAHSTRGVTRRAQPRFERSQSSSLARDDGGGGGGRVTAIIAHIVAVVATLTLGDTQAGSQRSLAVGMIGEAVERRCGLTALPDELDNIVYIEESVPYICDPAGGAQRFLSYSAGPRLLAIAADRDLAPERLRNALVASLKGGFPLTIDLGGLPDFDFVQHFDSNFFPKEVFDRAKLFTVEVFGPLLRPAKGDATPDAFNASSDFRLQLVSTLPEPPSSVAEFCTVLHIGTAEDSDDDGDAVEDMVCGREVKKNSADMAEEAFDGELEAVQKLITQGYHVDSVDGHEHTALSEAAAQGHADVVNYLLGLGADPNRANDRGRAALYRATFNNHLEMMTLLMEHGADPDAKDKEHNTPLDACHSDEARAVLEEWDRERTVALIAERNAEIARQKSLRIQTAAQREYEARRSVTEDLVALVHAGGAADALRERLQTIVDETEADKRPNPRPIANVNSRDERGHTLLALAAWKNKVEIAEFLLTHHGTLEPESDFFDPDKTARRVFKPQVNSRNQQGWTPVRRRSRFESGFSKSAFVSHISFRALRESASHTCAACRFSTCLPIARSLSAGRPRVVSRERQDGRDAARSRCEPDADEQVREERVPPRERPSDARRAGGLGQRRDERSVGPSKRHRNECQSAHRAA
jgi:ankyrin repeat protein